MSDTKDSTQLSDTAPAAAPLTNAKPSSGEGGVFLGLTLGQAVISLSWPILLLVAVYAFHLNTRLQTLEAGIRSRPAIKVVNVAETIRSLIGSGLTADQAIAQSDARFQKYADAGYIVIDNNAVMAAPKQAKLP